MLASRDVPGGTQLAVELHTEPERVPGVLLVPASRRPWPGALLLHGFTSHKERMIESAGRALLKRGVASLAIDLPLHGEREGRIDALSLARPLQVVQQWRLAVAEARSALELLVGIAAIDARRLGLVGYSLGAFLGLVVAADQPLLKAVVLAAGGDLPDRTPFATLVRTFADPQRAVRKLRGRPLLMINGRLDRTVTAPQAERLFAAARDPKELRWYSGGHWPPSREIDYAAEWLAQKLATNDQSTQRLADR